MTVRHSNEESQAHPTCQRPITLTTRAGICTECSEFAVARLPSVELPDADGRHVVAAAIHGGASLIVTFNLKDFPPERLKPYNLTAQHPDDFIFDLLDLHAARVCEAAANHRRSLKNPPKRVDEYLDIHAPWAGEDKGRLPRSWLIVTLCVISFDC